jgi:hypothetical protein
MCVEQRQQATFFFSFSMALRCFSRSCRSEPLPADPPDTPNISCQ